MHSNRTAGNLVKVPWARLTVGKTGPRALPEAEAKRGQQTAKQSASQPASQVDPNFLFKYCRSRGSKKCNKVHRTGNPMPTAWDMAPRNTHTRQLTSYLGWMAVLNRVLRLVYWGSWLGSRQVFEQIQIELPAACWPRHSLCLNCALERDVLHFKPEFHKHWQSMWNVNDLVTRQTSSHRTANRRSNKMFKLSVAWEPV